MHPPLPDHTAAKFEAATAEILADPDLNAREREEHLTLTRLVYGVTETELHTYLTTGTHS